MRESTFRRIAQFVLVHYKVIFVAMLLSGVGSYLLVRKLPLISDLAALLPDDYQSVKTLEQIKVKVGGLGDLIVLIESDHPEANRRFAEALAPLLLQSPYVGYIDYHTNIEFFKKNALLYLSLEDLEEIRDRLEERINEEKLKLLPFYVSLDDEEEEGAEPFDLAEFKKKYLGKEERSNYYESKDHRLLAMRLKPLGTDVDIKFVREMIGAVQKIVAQMHPRQFDPSMEVYYGGEFKNRVDEYDVIIDDIQSTAFYAILGVILLITFYFRQPLAFFFAAVPLGVGILWTFAVTYLVIGNLNLITAFLFAVLFGLGIDFVVHLFSRYAEECRAGKGVEEALVLAITQTSKALLTAALTTSIAFFSLLITDFKGFSEFGFIAGIGLLLCLAAAVLFLPAMIIVATRLGLLRIKPASVRASAGARCKGRFFVRPGLILTIGGLLTLVSLGELPWLEFEYDFTNLRANLPSTIAVKHKLTEIFPESASPAVVIAETPDDLVAVVAAVEKKMAEDKESPSIDRVRAIWSALPKGQEDKLEVITEIRGLLKEEQIKLLKPEEQAEVRELQEKLNVRELTVADLPENVQRLFQGRDGTTGQFAFIYPSVPLRDGKEAIKFADDVRLVETASGKRYYASSAAVIFADVLTITVKDGKVAIVVTLTSVFLLLLLDFRRLRETLIALVPLVAGVLWMCGIMVASAIKLNFYNMVVLPAVIGIGVDAGVHLYHRYKEEGVGSLGRVLRGTGGAVVVTSLTTMIGFAGMVGAWHPGLKAIGDLALIGIGACLVSALTVLPGLLQMLEERSQGRNLIASRATAETTKGPLSKKRTAAGGKS